MNTHDIDLELPPLPEGMILEGIWVVTKDEMIAYRDACINAAIEADRKRRGEPVAWRWQWKDLPDSGWQLSSVGGWRETDAIRAEPLYLAPIAPQPALDAADLAFIADELRQAGKNRAADMVMQAMAYPTQPAEPVKVPRPHEFNTGNEKLDTLLEDTYYLVEDGGMDNAIKWHESLQEFLTILEPVKVPSGAEIWQFTYDFNKGSFRDSDDVINYARALLARYGRPRTPEKVPCDGAARRAQEFLDMLTSFSSNYPEVIHAFNGGDVELRVDDLRALISSSEPVSHPTNAQIREVFLANGFTIKPGQDDLKPYVYEAARALLDKYGAK